MIQLMQAVELLERGDYAAADEAFLAIGGQQAERGRGFALRGLGDLEGSLECFETAGPAEEEAFARYALGLPAVPDFWALVTSDPMTIHNLGQAMHAEGHKRARSVLSEGIARGMFEGYVPEALRSLAEYEAPKHAWRIVAQADDMEAEWQRIEEARSSPAKARAKSSSRSR